VLQIRQTTRPEGMPAGSTNTETTLQGEAMSAIPTPGPPGRPRSVLFVIVIGFLTLGIYWWYWAYKTHDELKLRTGEGLGGVLGLVVWIVIQPVSVFVIPSEIGNMYARSGQPKPVTGWTGLWMVPFGIFLIPAIVWIVKVQGSLNRYWTSATAPV
jgi:hypothetical protein